MTDSIITDAARERMAASSPREQLLAMLYVEKALLHKRTGDLQSRIDRLTVMPESEFCESKEVRKYDRRPILRPKPDTILQRWLDQ